MGMTKEPFSRLLQESRYTEKYLIKAGKLKKASILILKLSVSAGLLYMLISKIGADTIINNIRLLNPASFIAAIGMYLIGAYFSSLRWALLVPYNINIKKLFSMFMIGSFFNHYLPGIIGGDAVKAYYLSEELKKRDLKKTGGSRQDASQISRLTDSSFSSSLTVSIASVFMDRFIGFFTLQIISMAALLIGFNYLEGTAIRWFIPVVFVVSLVFSMLIFKFRIGKTFKFMFNVYEYFSFYKGKKYVLIKAAFYSAIIQFLAIGAIYILSKGISLNLSFISLLIFVPIIILISFIPISISGIGLREGAFVFFLGTVGVSPDLSVTLSLLWFLSVICAGLWGLFEYLRFKPAKGIEGK